MNKRCLLIIAIILLIFSACSIANQPIVDTSQSLVLTAAMEKDNVSCEELFILEITKREKALIWSSFTSSQEYKNTLQILKNDGFKIEMKNRIIDAYYSDIYNDTILSINIPFSNPKYPQFKLEFVKLFSPNNDKSIFMTFISKSLDSLSTESIIDDSSYIYVTLSEDGPFSPDQEFPEFSIFNTGTEQILFSIFSLPGLGTIGIVPCTTINDNFLICFANCYDPCACVCFGQPDQSICLGRCWTYCRNRCVIANWWRL